MAADAWVALGAGGVAIGAVLGNVLLWIVTGAVAGLALGSPEDDWGDGQWRSGAAWCCARRPRRRCASARAGG